MAVQTTPEPDSNAHLNNSAHLNNMECLRMPGLPKSEPVGKYIDFPLRSKGNSRSENTSSPFLRGNTPLEALNKGRKRFAKVAGQITQKITHTLDSNIKVFFTGPFSKDHPFTENQARPISFVYDAAYGRGVYTMNFTDPEALVAQITNGVCQLYTISTFIFLPGRKNPLPFSQVIRAVLAFTEKSLSKIYDEGLFSIYALASSESKRKGFGSLLAEKVQKHLESREDVAAIIATLVTSHEKSAKLFKKLGYTITGFGFFQFSKLFEIFNFSRESLLHVAKLLPKFRDKGRTIYCPEKYDSVLKDVLTKLGCPIEKMLTIKRDPGERTALFLEDFRHYLSTYNPPKEVKDSNNSEKRKSIKPRGKKILSDIIGGIMGGVQEALFDPTKGNTWSQLAEDLFSLEDPFGEVEHLTLNVRISDLGAVEAIKFLESLGFRYQSFFIGKNGAYFSFQKLSGKLFDELKNLKKEQGLEILISKVFAGVPFENLPVAVQFAFSEMSTLLDSSYESVFKNLAEPLAKC